MNKHDMDDIFTQRLRERFLASTAGLDPKVLARLSEARRRAVDAVGSQRTHAWGWRMPAGAVALAFVAVVGGALWMSGSGPGPSAPFSAANTDAPLIETQDNLDMYADLDFYQWMETQDQPVAAPDSDTVDDVDDQDDDGVGG
ncbi:MAG TPA: hypothetical protein VHP13_11655 [Gammaproteobacteria bacterium]|jgi:hypothetical protein|nr:hypothetical protein [Gammaproteobacteria bacterium]